MPDHLIFKALIMILGVSVGISGYMAIRSKTPALICTAMLLAFDLVGSWFVDMSSRPPARPVWDSALDLSVLIIFFLNRLKYKNLYAQRLILPAAYFTMIASNGVYLATSGREGLLCNVINDVLFVVVLLANSWASTNRDGADMADGNTHSDRVHGVRRSSSVGRR